MSEWIKSRRGGFTLAVTACVLWGSAYPVLKICFKDMGLVNAGAKSLVAFAGLRFLLAAGIIWLISLLFLRLKIPRSRDYLKRSAIIGLFQTTLLYYFFYNGLAVTSGMKSAILNASGTFFLVVLAHFLLPDDRLNWGKWIGILMGFLGIIAVNWGAGFDWEFSMTAEGFIIVCCLFASIGDILTKKWSDGVHPFLLNAAQMTFGSLVLLWLGREEVANVAAQLEGRSLMLFLYAALLSALAFSIWFSVLKYHKAGEVAVFRFVIPLAGAFLSSLFIPGEQFSVKLLLGLLLVCAGIVFVHQKGLRREYIENQRNVTEGGIFHEQ